MQNKLSEDKPKFKAGDESKKNISTNQIVYTLNEGDGGGKDDEVSISSTFYAHIFFVQTSFLCLEFGSEQTFVQKNARI